jgi:galactokinase
LVAGKLVETKDDEKKIYLNNMDPKWEKKVISVKKDKGIVFEKHSWANYCLCGIKVFAVFEMIDESRE